MFKMIKKYTMLDVAETAGVSLSTVSRVLNNSVKVSKGKREKVLKVVKELDYNINSLASNLASCRSKEIGVIIPDICNPFFANVFKGIDDIISARGYSILLYNTNYNKRNVNDYIQHIIERRVAGLILVSIELNKNLMNSVNNKTNIVSIQTNAEGIDCIDTTNEKGSFEATEYLIKNGHKSIAFFGWKYNILALSERLRGYKRALLKYNIPFDEKYVIDCGFTQEEVYFAALKFIEGGNYPTAIFAINDNTAIGIMLAFEQLGIRIPQDVSLIGFDNISTARLVSPKLTTVAQPIYYLGETAGEMVLNKIQKEGQGIEKNVVLPTKLIIRDSVRKIK
ncbi:LacI family DNA-binding transcriptional regulator [Clostridium sediminicola]|uniref:LacI family DNA-binding transcriptional regulator n=1 Tax=Clostridium sediminicola TaxID=3114879 RepID=UPI0031F24048